MEESPRGLVRKRKKARAAAGPCAGRIARFWEVPAERLRPRPDGQPRSRGRVPARETRMQRAPARESRVRSAPAPSCSSRARLKRNRRHRSPSRGAPEPCRPPAAGNTIETRSPATPPAGNGIPPPPRGWLSHLPEWLARVALDTIEPENIAVFNLLGSLLSSGRIFVSSHARL